MKRSQLFALAAVSALSMCWMACGKKESSSPSPAAPTPEKPAATAPAAPAAPAPASTEAQSLLDKAKALIGNKDYAGAMKILKDAAALKLTPEQQKLLDELKATAQKALAAEAASEATKKATDALGGALGK
jgi:hypothetical protein